MFTLSQFVGDWIAYYEIGTLHFYGNLLGCYCIYKNNQEKKERKMMDDDAEGAGEEDKEEEEEEGTVEEESSAKVKQLTKKTRGRT